MAIETDSPQFGSVIERGGSERRVWWLVVPGVIALAALLAFAGVSLSRSSGLESQLRIAKQQAADAQKQVEERDQLLQKARADEDVLRKPGRGAALLAAASPDAPSSGVALYHPERHAVQVYAFGLGAPPAGQEYRVEAVAGQERKPLGVLSVDERGGAFLLSKDVPENATELAVRLAPAAGDAARQGQGQGDASDRAGSDAGAVVLSGALPRAGEAGVAEAPRVQARTPAARGRR